MNKTLKNVSDNLLNQTFFSKENTDIIQNAIRHHVWSASNHQFKIGRQSDTELNIIMRSVYYQYAKNQPDNIRGQIEVLNKMVLNECVPKIMSSIQQYLSYTVDLVKGPQYMDHPKNVSNAGSKSLQYKLF